MKLLVFSDNHGDIEVVDRILAAHPDADRFISLGDSQMTEPQLSVRKIFGVRGNYPFEPEFPAQLVFEFEGHRTLLTHGHHYYVKTGLYNLASEAHDQQCEIVLYGHTHQFLADDREGILFVNPGSTTIPKSGNRKTYAVLQITEPKVVVEIYDATTFLPFLTYVKKY